MASQKYAHWISLYLNSTHSLLLGNKGCSRVPELSLAFGGCTLKTGRSHTCGSSSKHFSGSLLWGVSPPVFGVLGLLFWVSCLFWSHTKQCSGGTSGSTENHSWWCSGAIWDSEDQTQQSTLPAVLLLWPCGVSIKETQLTGQHPCWSEAS